MTSLGTDPSKRLTSWPFVSQFSASLLIRLGCINTAPVCISNTAYSKSLPYTLHLELALATEGDLRNWCYLGIFVYLLDFIKIIIIQGRQH